MLLLQKENRNHRYVPHWWLTIWITYDLHVQTQCQEVINLHLSKKKEKCSGLAVKHGCVLIYENKRWSQQCW